MKNNTRVLNKKITLSEKQLVDFFDKRSTVKSELNPYVSSIYQDNTPELALARDAFEKAHVLPKLQLHKKNKVLDLGCGVGRWADVLVGKVSHYVGIDFSSSLISEARKRHKGNGAEFHVLRAQDVTPKKFGSTSYFDRVIVSGVLLYMNDESILTCLKNLRGLLANHTIFYIREPLALKERLTLNGIWSKELKQEYYAIYRTKEELESIINSAFKENIKLSLEELYKDESLNNRRETKQHYAVFKLTT